MATERVHLICKPDLVERVSNISLVDPTKSHHSFTLTRIRAFIPAKSYTGFKRSLWYYGHNSMMVLAQNLLPWNPKRCQIALLSCAVMLLFLEHYKVPINFFQGFLTGSIHFSLLSCLNFSTAWTVKRSKKSRLIEFDERIFRYMLATILPRVQCDTMTSIICSIFDRLQHGNILPLGRKINLPK